MPYRLDVIPTSAEQAASEVHRRLASEPELHEALLRVMGHRVPDPDGEARRLHGGGVMCLPGRVVSVRALPPFHDRTPADGVLVLDDV